MTDIIIVGDPLTAPTSPSPTLCRISGFFVDHIGQVLKGLVIRVISKDYPIVSGSLGVIGERADVRTDNAGFVQFDALRNSRVDLQFDGRPEQTRTLYVPNTAAADLFDLAFPYLQSVAPTLDPAGIAVGASSTILATGTLSDTRTVDVTAFSTFAQTNSAVATLASSSLTGLSAGTTVISITAADTDAIMASAITGFEDAFKDLRDTLYIRLPAIVPTLTATATLTVT